MNLLCLVFSSIFSEYPGYNIVTPIQVSRPQEDLIAVFIVQHLQYQSFKASD